VKRPWSARSASRLGLAGVSALAVIGVVIGVESATHRGPHYPQAHVPGTKPVPPSADVLLTAQSPGLVVLSPTTGGVIRRITVKASGSGGSLGVPLGIAAVPGEPYAYGVFAHGGADLVYRVSLATGSATLFSSARHMEAADVALSPDGKTLAFLNSWQQRGGPCCMPFEGPSGSLVIASTATGSAFSEPVSVLLHSYPGVGVVALAWSPDDRHLLVVAQSARTIARLVVVDTKTMKTSTIPTAPALSDTLTSAAWAPSGATIYLGWQRPCLGTGASCINFAHPFGAPLTAVAYPSGKVVSELSTGVGVEYVAVSPSGKVVVSSFRYHGNSLTSTETFVEVLGSGGRPLDFGVMSVPGGSDVAGAVERPVQWVSTSALGST
jgi:hypothetical protein